MTLAPTARLFLAVAGEPIVKNVPEMPPWGIGCGLCDWVSTCVAMIVDSCYCADILYKTYKHIQAHTHRERKTQTHTDKHQIFRENLHTYTSIHIHTYLHTGERPGF